MLILVQRVIPGSPEPWQPEAEIGAPEPAAAPGAQAPFATVLGSNPLGAAGPVPTSVLRGPRVVLLSGWLEAEVDAEELTGVRAGDNSGVDPRTWGPRGWACFEAACRELRVHLERVDAATRVCFRTRATDVLSDAPSCTRFLRAKKQWGDDAGRLELLLDPVAMLASVMLPGAEDHVRRVLEYVAPDPGVCAVLLSNVEAPSEPGGPVRGAPLHRGLIPPAALVQAAREHIPPTTPIVLLDEEVDRQRSLLGA